MKYIKCQQIIFLAGMLATLGAHSEEDRFSVSGFGYQDYRQANANQQDGADRRGTWGNDIIAFVISAKASDRDTVWAQLESTATEPTAFTWAFLDHRFSDNLTAHVGRVKLPMGLYNEFVDNKWLQLGVVPPSIYSGASDMVSDAYSGIGIDWTTGSLFTQVYGGTTYVNPAITPADTFPADVSPHEHRRLFGMRITWNTPLEGLRFLVSANEGQLETVAPSSIVGQLGHETRTILSLDYVSDRLDIKSEYAIHKIPPFPGVDTSVGAPPNTTFPGLTGVAWYLQGGYKIGLWTPYVRYDGYQRDQLDSSNPSLYQKDKVIGVSYKINDNINARIEDHVIQGYGLTDMGSKVDWNLVAAGINFIF